ncbi:MAG: WXG100 family type VII secretion target [Oscillospiraceae bacterium]|nr:WXG100 family type VII secretion target [Oscillospiraceae bacterium]MCD8323331.1 WXG100 family type VII secretion target [Oscillospiraceae bacterium]
MASRIEVTISELQSAATKITEAASDYQSAADTLKAAADELAATWEGDSQVAFVAEQEAAYEWYKKMAALCEEYAQSMNTAAERYVETDTEAASTIKAR